jgi:hypothetical protein
MVKLKDSYIQVFVIWTLANPSHLFGGSQSKELNYEINLLLEYVWKPWKPLLKTTRFMFFKTISSHISNLSLKQ